MEIAFDLLVVILCGGYNDPDFFWLPERLLRERVVPALQHSRGD